MSLSGSFVIVAVDAEPVHGPHPFELDLADGRVHGRVLNRFNGSAEVADDAVTFGAIVATRMAGPPELMAAEDGVFRVLTGTLQIDRADDGTVQLAGESGSITLAPRPDGVEDASAV
ncbi:MAG TPA: META domain-containing protein [Candidatus Nanopelagicales bacterium]|nr:META domain-containing protein [Candidatus Nanopelagicales bacterium]